MTQLPKAKRALTKHTGAKLTATQSVILTAGAQREGKIALPLPKGLAGAAAKMAVTRMIDHGWLQEVDATPRSGEPLWRETGDGQGTTLVLTDAGLLVIGTEISVIQRKMAIDKHIAAEPAPRSPMPRVGTKQAMLISLLRAPEGATMEEIIAATGWLVHTVRGVISGALGKKLGLVVTSANTERRGRVYRIEQVAQRRAL